MGKWRLFTFGAAASSGAGASQLNSMPDLLTVEEAAHFLRISRGLAYQEVHSGEIPSIRIGRTIRIPKHRLKQLVEAQSSDGSGASNGNR